jgi:RNA polymerase sigma factor (sigma-70 family)
MQSDTMQSNTIDSLATQRSRFLQFVRRRVDSPATAEDILQAAYTRALEQSPTLRSEESATAWFYRILRNAVIDHYRHRAAEDRALDRWAQDLTTETAPDPASNSQLHEIVCECINDVLPTLKSAYNEILRSVDLADNSLEAFAKSADITPGNAAVRIHRARQALKKQLTIICGTCAKHGCVNCNCARS